jgi:hypothetical protein
MFYLFRSSEGEFSERGDPQHPCDKWSDPCNRRTSVKESIWFFNSQSYVYFVIIFKLMLRNAKKKITYTRRTTPGINIY